VVGGQGDEGFMIYKYVHCVLTRMRGGGWRVVGLEEGKMRGISDWGLVDNKVLRGGAAFAE
jgi:hypothetical protein